MSTEPPGSLDLPPPPPERWWERLRRRWRSTGRHSGLRYWMLSRGLSIVSAVAAVFVMNGLFIGWRTAYDVTIGITSPGSVHHPYLAWPLSLMGWLVGPAVAGAVAGWVVNDFISSRRSREPIDVVGGRDNG